MLLSIPRIHAHAHPRPNDIIVHVNNLHVCTCYMSLRLDVVFGEVEFYQPLAVKWVPFSPSHNCSTSTWILGSYFFDDNFSSRDVYKRNQKKFKKYAIIMFLCLPYVPTSALCWGRNGIVGTELQPVSVAGGAIGGYRMDPDGMMIILSCVRFMIGTITVLASKKWVDEWAHELILINYIYNMNSFILILTVSTPELQNS